MGSHPDDCIPDYEISQEYISLVWKWADTVVQEACKANTESNTFSSGKSDKED